MGYCEVDVQNPEEYSVLEFIPREFHFVYLSYYHSLCFVPKTTEGIHHH